MDAPKFRRAINKHRVPRLPKGKFVLATWTQFSCDQVSEPMTLQEAYRKYMDALNTTSCNQVIGILDHKRRTVVRSWGTKDPAIVYCYIPAQAR